MPRKNNIQVRRGNSTEWSNENPILDSGEIGYDYTSKTLKIGDASNNWNGLVSLRLGGNPNLEASSLQSNLICIRSPLINFKTIADINIFAVPSGYVFLLEKMEIITTLIESAGTSPTVRFGNLNSYAEHYGPTVVETNQNGSRHIILDPQNAISENSVVTFGVTVASTASSHYGHALLTGFLIKTESPSTNTPTPTPVPTSTPAPSSITQIDYGGYNWTGAGTVADPYITTYLLNGEPSIRGESPGNWTSTNRPAWEINTNGTFNYRISSMSSVDDWADHWLYKSSDGGSTWTVVAQFNYRITTLTTRSFAVSAGDIVEQRGNGSLYASDTWIQNPTVWLA
jgi:hypothetical protein